MELVDRYLHNVRFFLPRRDQADIIRELADDLQSQMQDREAEFGRPLNEEEVAGILKRCGPPLLVAGRYLPQQHMVGPALFPRVPLRAEARALDLLAALAGGVGGAGGLQRLVPRGPSWTCACGHAHRLVAHGRLPLLRHHDRLCDTRTDQVRLGLFDRWDPRRLPAVRDPRVISRFTSISEIVWGSLFLLWWVGVIHFPTFSDDAGQAVLLTWTASFQRFYWPVFLLQVATTALAIVNLFRPSWTSVRAGWRLAGNVCTAIVAYLLVDTGSWVEVQAPGLSEHARTVLLSVANRSLYWLFIGIAIVSTLVTCFEDGRRIYRISVKAHAPADGDGRAGHEPTA